MSCKKITLLFITVFIYLQSGYSKPVDLEKAQCIARSFLSEMTFKTLSVKTRENEEVQLAYSCNIPSEKGLSSLQSYYYVFNRGENRGFIVISGDDRIKPVLGYSDTGKFDMEKLPFNFSYWLDLYKYEIDAVLFGSQIHSEMLCDPIPMQTKEFAPSVAPLLKNIRYNQDKPYNDLCPIIPSSQTRAATGCAATSMAEVMKYYQWPLQGRGSYSYVTETLKLKLSAEFDSTWYDWNNILDSYPSPEICTSVQNQAIATLMLHCGIGINMDYNKASGASTSNTVYGLINFFRYSPSIQLHHRNYYTTTQWTEIIKEELNKKRPVIYHAQSSSGAHSFICDGYDNNGLFHINWGWGGTSNGYFELAILNPEQQGIGGGSGGYSQVQRIITGIEPENGTQTPATYQLRLSKGMTAEKEIVAKNETVVVNLGYRNRGTGSFYGLHGLGLFQNGVLVKVLYQGAFERKENGMTVRDTLTIDYGRDNLQWKFAASDLPEGNFRIYPLYHEGETAGDNWQIMKGGVSMPAFLNAVINLDEIKLLADNENISALSISELKATHRICQNRVGRFEFTVKNSGVEYYGAMRIKIIHKENSNIFQDFPMEGITIEENEIGTLQTSQMISLPPGEYYAFVQYDSKDGHLREVGERITVQIKEEPQENPKWSILNFICHQDLNQINSNEEISFDVTIKNSGGYGDDKIYAAVFKSKGEFITYVNNLPVYLDKDEAQTYTIKGITNLDPGKYDTFIFILHSDNNEWEFLQPVSINKLTFTVVSGGSGIVENQRADISIYPNPADDFILITSDKVVSEISVYSLSGTLLYKEIPESGNKVGVNVSHLAQGSYLLRINTEGEVINRKLIKK